MADTNTSIQIIPIDIVSSVETPKKVYVAKMEVPGQELGIEHEG